MCSPINGRKGRKMEEATEQGPNARDVAVSVLRAAAEQVVDAPPIVDRIELSRQSSELWIGRVVSRNTGQYEGFLVTLE